MNNELINILSNSNKDIDNQKLMDYISNTITDEDRHALEKEMLDSQFLNDAVEGLSQIDNRKKVADITEKLNAHLRKQLSKKKQKHKGRVLMPASILYFSICLILLLALIAFMLVRRHLG